MNVDHRIVREMLRQFTKPKAEKMLHELLPEREATAIYFCDVLDWERWKVGEEKLFCEPGQVTRIKNRGYLRLKAELNKHL